LATALADLLRDPDRRKLLADAGRRTVEQYDWSTVTARVVEVYETVAETAPVPVPVDVDHAVDAFADDLAGSEDDDPGRLTVPLLGPGADLAHLQGAANRVALARSFHNAAVQDTRTVRWRRIPRLLRLAGHRAMPTFFEIDDTALAG